MKNTLEIGLALTLAACGKVEPPLQMGIAMDGYTIPCGEVATQTPPLDYEAICGGKEVSDIVHVPPSALVNGKNEVQNLLQCALGPVLDFELLDGEVDGMRPNTLFVGGKTNGILLGNTPVFTSEVGMQFVRSYVTDLEVDVNGNTVPSDVRLDTVTLLHETGHIVGAMSASDAGYGKGSKLKFFSKYDHDKLAHDLSGPSIMAVPLNVDTPLYFSPKTRDMVVDNLNFSGVKVSPEEYGNQMVNLDEICAEEITALQAVVPKLPQ